MLVQYWKAIERGKNRSVDRERRKGGGLNRKARASECVCNPPNKNTKTLKLID